MPFLSECMVLPLEIRGTCKMKKLTAYNQDVQVYIQGFKSLKILKESIIESIKESVIQTGKSFEKLFPAKTKRKLVMDEIVYYLSGAGICKVSAETLAKNTGASIRTVSDAVKRLKETGEIIVGGLADGKNKYVFVYKKHPNFKEILDKIFNINAEQIAEQVAEQIAEHKNAEAIDNQGIQGEKLTSNNTNSINSFKKDFKQDFNNIKQSIEYELMESKNDAEEQERVYTYYVNEFQFKVYHSIKAGDYHKQIKDISSVIGLRVGSNCNKKGYIFSLQALTKIDKYLKNGYEVDSIPALFSAKYKEYLEKDMHQQECTDTSKKRNIIPLYNWLED